MDKEKETQHIAWHPAFMEALQAVLEDYSDILEFYPEVQLTSEPLIIDCVIIKKKKDVVIKKDIAVIFREYNILEYKSPGHYVSVDDFYKVYGYACLYASFKKAPVTEMTISFVESHYPEKLLKHLKNIRNYSVEESYPGVYNIRGDIFPIQVIDNRKISEEGNLWLKGLSNRLDAGIFNKIKDEASKKGKFLRLGAYIDVIVRANYEKLKEEIMSKTLTMEQILEETGIAARIEAKAEARGEERGVAIGEARGVTIGEARGEARGEEKKALEIAKNMLDAGFSLESIASITQLDPEKIKSLMP